MKVLIADDSSLFRKNLVELLHDVQGLQIVGQAQDVGETMHAISVTSPDVLTLEVSINGENGINVLKKIKQEQLVPVVIVLTNHSTQPYQKRCQRAGADFFLDKTSGGSEVRRIIQELLPRFSVGANEL
jgi:DNA-binding NarL/FixJ family response regulator